MKKRTISGVVILLILITSLCLSNKIFSILMAICSVLGFIEFYKLKYSEDEYKIIKIFSIISLCFLVLNNTFFKLNYLFVLIIIILGLMLPILVYNSKRKYDVNDSLYIMGIILFLGSAFASIAYMRDASIYKCIYIFIIAFVTDTYAYIGGSLIGKHKLTDISPKKTIEGTIIGTFMGAIIGTIYYFAIVGGNLFVAILVSLFLTILSELGDLVFSSIKRNRNIKDYSNLIPGHGGMLDRFDSVIFVSLGLALIMLIS